MIIQKKQPKPITRNGCQAVLRVLGVKDIDGWKAKEFVPIHNHELVSVIEIQMVRSNRDCSEAMVPQVKSMNKVGIKTSQIVSYMALQGGGYNKLPC